MTEPALATLAAAAALAAFVTGFLRASVGGGIGLALTPVLSLALPAQSALGLTGFNAHERGGQDQPELAPVPLAPVVAEDVSSACG